jgi:hypothetical protein
VNKVVMMPAEQYQVVQACFAAVSPVFYVMSIDKPRVGRNARRIGGGMERDRRPMESGSPFSSSLIATIELSQAMRRDVTAETWGPSSRLHDSPSTWTTTW